MSVNENDNKNKGGFFLTKRYEHDAVYKEYHVNNMVWFQNNARIPNYITTLTQNLM